ncbi:hypothetical protein VB780_03485 [Leptolyngbya sp. CCNP1308]|uniref:hypothetical protein n=1 Tax=Leptolyngbya sp. CCNP1308 TaxID=3110255 RepID=UPI002B1EB450|nr:hypothetical protein [Leptolyngbya sp. CCNP1308]MEA5447617.1 hypothetical protein [Leptolyngbya sp. CCNP1308]
MAWNSYGLDREAQQLVLAARQRDEALPPTQRSKKASLNQAHKMRMSVSYGLERFWGEQLRLQDKEQNKAQFWKETWDAFVSIMARTGVTIPNGNVQFTDTQAIQEVSAELWKLDLADQRVALAVLAQLCDALIWWTQRYKGGARDDA